MSCRLDIPVAITDSKASPAPETSIGFTDKEGNAGTEVQSLGWYCSRRVLKSSDWNREVSFRQFWREPWNIAKCARGV